MCRSRKGQAGRRIRRAGWRDRADRAPACHWQNAWRRHEVLRPAGLRRPEALRWVRTLFRPTGELVGRGWARFALPTLRVKPQLRRDRKSTRLNSSHQIISYAVFCLKKKKNRKNMIV